MINLDNTSYCGEFSIPTTKAASLVFVYSDLNLRYIRKGSSTGCHICEWLISEWVLYYKATYDRLIDQEDVLHLYAAIFSASLASRIPIDEVPYFGLWKGDIEDSSPEPRYVIRTRTSIDVLTPKGLYHNLFSVVLSVLGS